MVIARKLLAPTLILLVIGSITLIGLLATGLSRSLQIEEDRNLRILHQTLENEVSELSKLAQALALQTANNPEVQMALASEDRERLIALSQAGYQAINGLVQIDRYIFTKFPAGVILALGNDGQSNISASRQSMLEAGTTHGTLTGIEITGDGLYINGIAPVQANSSDNVGIMGSVEIGFLLDENSLNDLRTENGGEWQLLVATSVLDSAGVKERRWLHEGPNDELMLATSTLASPIFGDPGNYRLALDGQLISSRIKVQGNTYAMLTFPLRDTSGKVVGVADTIIDQTPALRKLTNRIFFASLAAALALLLSGLLLNRLTRQTLQPIQALTKAAQAISQGNLRYPLPVLHQTASGEDEIEQLTRSFHSMGQQLRRLVGDLEEAVAERTRGLETRTMQLQAAAEIARDVTQQAEVEVLLVQAVNLVRQRFDFYHAGVFLIDESSDFAVLRAATGEAGKQMIANNHRLRVGRVGIVGAACGTGEPRVAADVEMDPTHFQNPLLPETRAEAAIPLRIGERVIGALDVQSRNADAFSDSDITVLQIIADQLAIAINNARLIAELNRMVAELQEAQGQITRKNWLEITRAQPRRIGYRYTSSATTRSTAAQSIQLVPLTRKETPVEARRAIQSGEIIQGEAESISVPIRLRGHPIGVIHLRFDAPVEQTKVAGLIEEVGDRLALVMESARLLQEAQRLAQREQQINLIATQMRSSVNLETVLQNTVRELGKALGARRAYIQVGEYEDDQQTADERDA